MSEEPVTWECLVDGYPSFTVEARSPVEAAVMAVYNLYENCGQNPPERTNVAVRSDLQKPRTRLQVTAKPGIWSYQAYPME